LGNVLPAFEAKHVGGEPVAGARKIMKCIEGSLVKASLALDMSGGIGGSSAKGISLREFVCFCDAC
jgi:hypothetical protein